MGHLNDRQFASHYLDNKTAKESDIPTEYCVGVAGKYTSSLPTLANNDWGFLRLTSDGKLMVDTELTVDGNVIIDNVAVWATNIADSSTAGFALIDASGHPQVDVLTLPGGLTGYEEDTAHTTADKGLMPLAVRNDTAGALAGTDGDYIPVTTDALGNIRVVHTDVAGNEASVIATIKSLKSDVSSVAGVVTNVNGGNRDAGTQTVTLADDDPSVTSLGIMDDWDATEDSAIGTDGAVVMFEAKSGQKTAVDDGDAVIQVTNLNGELVLAGYSWSGNAVRFEEIDPIPEHYITETLADVTNGTDGTYYYYVDMNSYRKGSFQLDGISGGSGTCTATVEGTLQDDGTAQGSCSYDDIGADTFGAANWTADAMLIDNAEKLSGYKYVRIKVIAATGAADDADWTIHHKRLY